MSLAQLRSSSLTICRNDSCHSLSFAGISEPEPDGRLVHNRVYYPKYNEIAEGRPSYDASVFPAAEGGFLLHVTYSPWSSADLKDGDIYVLTVQTGDGRKLLDMRRTVASEETQPNGPSCPPVYRAARLD